MIWPWVIIIGAFVILWMICSFILKACGVGGDPEVTWNGDIIKHDEYNGWGFLLAVGIVVIVLIIIFIVRNGLFPSFSRKKHNDTNEPYTQIPPQTNSNPVDFDRKETFTNCSVFTKGTTLSYSYFAKNWKTLPPYFSTTGQITLTKDAIAKLYYKTGYSYAIQHRQDLKDVAAAAIFNMGIIFVGGDTSDNCIKEIWCDIITSNGNLTIPLFYGELEPYEQLQYELAAIENKISDLIKYVKQYKMRTPKSSSKNKD